jgi:hypothetical protein
VFRFDTFGDQSFWGAALQLHKAIEGSANGGVGPGVSPKTALAVGLKVDATVIPTKVAAGRSRWVAPVTAPDAGIRAGAVRRSSRQCVVLPPME